MDSSTNQATNKVLMPKQTEDCSVCYEPYTGSIRKSISCPFCQFSSCLKCVRRYMLESPEDAHCMSCRRAWNRDFIDSYLSRAFRIGDLKKHRENILLDREHARLPMLQPRVEAKVKATEVGKDISVENAKINELQVRIDKLRNHQLVLYRRKDRLERIASGTLDPEQENNDTSEKREVRQFTQKCPVNDCVGFLSTQWKCGTCQTWVCPDCLVPKGKEKDCEHTCDEDMKATAALIKKDTKPCPKCGMGISKVDGCDQMWCISCKTPFSWTTGRLVFGVVHNPHYYQFMRENNNAVRVVGDVPCGGLVGFYNLSRVIPKRFRNEIEQIHRTTAELLEGHLRNLPRLDEVPDHGDLGVLYSLKEISKEKWKDELWKRETKREKGLDLRGPIDLFANVCTEVLRRMSSGIPDEEFDTLMDQLRQLRIYVNSELEKIGKRYGCMVPAITNIWVFDAHGGNRKTDDRYIREHTFWYGPEVEKKLSPTAVHDIVTLISTNIIYIIQHEKETNKSLLCYNDSFKRNLGTTILTSLKEAMTQSLLLYPENKKDTQTTSLVNAVISTNTSV